ncbi:hypothetical protein G9A89_012108 [Geosiphon pyriformis]|nr:hypothetical protein G9A89_012108 [Geosiphon pyriformis]
MLFRRNTFSKLPLSACSLVLFLAGSFCVLSSSVASLGDSAALIPLNLDKITRTVEDQKKEWNIVEASDPELGGSVLNFNFEGSINKGFLPEFSTEDQRSFVLSFLMIIVSEIGDKTFLIAAIMAMQHSRLLVFSAAFCALIIMSVLSATLGHVVPNLIPKIYTNYMAAVLFLFFGIKMVSEGCNMTEEEANQELEEVTAELKERKEVHLMEEIEAGGMTNETKDGGLIEGLTNLCQFLFSPVFVQTFVLTFLGEWGDRSQIATIALAAAQDVYFVMLGTILGHSMCTSLAVIGGRMLAQKISLKTVTLSGAVLFIAFSIIYLYEAIYDSGT